MAILNLQNGHTNGQVINTKNHLSDIIWANFLEKGEEGYDGAGQLSTERDQLIQDKIIEDIVKGFTLKKDATSKSLNSLTWNMAIDEVIKIFQDKTKLINEKKQWVEDWKRAFQKDPTKDLSSLITNYIAKKIGDIGNHQNSGSWMSLANSAPDYNKFFTDIAKNEISTFIDDLDKQTTNIIEPNTIQTIDDEISRVLQNFNLSQSDKNKYQGVSEYIGLKEKALDIVGQIFKNSHKIQSDRPYRKISQSSGTSDKDVINAKIIEEFRKLCHGRKYIDDLARDSLRKAISGPNGFSNIIKSIRNAKLDPRFISVLNQCNSNNINKPEEFLKEIFGSAYQDAKRWFDKWKDLLDFDYKEAPVSGLGKTSFVFTISLKDQLPIIKGAGTEKDVLFDINEMKNSGYTLDEYSMELKTPELEIEKSLYTTDLFEQKFQEIINHFEYIAVIDFDAYNKLLKKYGIQNGPIPSATVKDMETLCPTIFNEDKNTLEDQIKRIMDDVKARMKAMYGVNYNSNLKITFQISWDAKSGGGILVKPIISDDSIKNITSIIWDRNTKTPLSEQTAIEKIFKAMDNKHIKIDPTTVPALKIKVLTPLDVAASTLYGVFKNHSKQLLTTFDIDFLSKLKTGDPITIDFLEKHIDGLKAAYDKFMNDNNNRFTVEFFVEKIDQNGIRVNYKITDTTNQDVTEVTNSADKIHLDNIYIKTLVPPVDPQKVTETDEFNDKLTDVLGNTKNELEQKLKKEFPNGIPDGLLDELTKHMDDIEQEIRNNPDILNHPDELLNFAKNFNIQKLMDIKKKMKSGTKIGILSLGSILGASSLLAGANAAKVATTNKKINATNSKNGKIKSSKKLAIISLLIGLMSAAGSIGTFIYLFLIQGGL